MNNGSTETLVPAPQEPERPEAPPGAVAPPITWWARLRSSLGRLSPTALSILETDSRLIATFVAPRVAGRLDQDRWPASRVRTGIVVGSVQSGKTANMLAVAAHALDHGVGLLIVLAGTRVALWLQTYERLLSQLDRSTVDDAWMRNLSRVLIPDPSDILGGEGRVDPNRYLRSQRPQVQAALASHRPVILVIPKEDAHLLELSRFLREAITDAVLTIRGTPLELIVLDDEADDGSILDATEGDKVTPRYIQQIWSGPQQPDETWHRALYATYVAYTATPQANFLQDQHNPLAPRDFRAALRVPFDSGALMPRSSTYREQSGVRGYYSGGRLFYELLSTEPGSVVKSAPFPIRLPGELDDAYASRFRASYLATLGESLRAYFVAGALRLILSERRISSVVGRGPLPADTLDALLPAPHCMLFHPSALKDEHFKAAEDIARWSASAPGQEDATSPPLNEDGVAVLDASGLSRRLSLEEHAWSRWIREYDETVRAVRVLPKGTYRTVGRIDWPEVRRVLETEVFPGTHLRVLNSDPRAAERPVFEKRHAPEAPGLFQAPSEIFSIFVAGNVLSRGLTIEGLTTSLFVRSANEPAADTQMQMQRWFGYRGDHLPFCRLFAHSDQLALFRSYHFNDEALKAEILAEMDLGLAAPRGPLVLQGDNFLATAKVDTRRVPLHPGPSPAVRVVEREDAELAQENLDILSTFLDHNSSRELNFPEGTVSRGRLSDRTFDLLGVADMLDSFRYSRHRPAPDDTLYSRWVSLQHAYGIAEPLLRLPGPPYVHSGVAPSTCPYSIAAYLRLWNALLKQRDARGLFPTDRPGLSWHLINLAEYQATQPRFYVGVRNGEGGPSSDPRLQAHGVRVMRRQLSRARDFVLETLWGTRGEGGAYFGDQLLDYHLHGRTPIPRLHEGVRWRPRGHPGLLLFHVVRVEDCGLELLTAGLGIPHGGPDHVAALRGNPR